MKVFGVAGSALWSDILCLPGLFVLLVSNSGIISPKPEITTDKKDLVIKVVHSLGAICAVDGLFAIMNRK